MRRLLFCLVLTGLVSATGCCTCPNTEPLLREIRKDLVESTRPGLADAMDKAKGPDGKPIYVDAYRDEKVGLVDRMILSIDRVFPAKDKDGKETKYVPEPLPWKKAAKDDKKGGK